MVRPLKTKQEQKDEQAIYDKENRIELEKKRSLFYQENPEKKDEISRKNAIYNKLNRVEIARKKAIYDKENKTELARKRVISNQKKRENQTKIQIITV